MEFRDFLNTDSTKDSVDESAILKLELITKINTLIGTAEIGMLKRIAKMLVSPALAEKESLEESGDISSSEKERV